MVEVLVLLQVLLFQSIILVDASVRNDKAKISVPDNEVIVKLRNEVVKEQSSDQISAKDEENEKSENDQLYYLPTQTMFVETNKQTRTNGPSTTSPPPINIDPASIQTSYQETTSILHKDYLNEEIHYKVPYQSQCVSETPAIELESRFLLPSNDLIKESVIMSGHLEIASKTNTGEDVTQIGYIVSRPSIALQGTVLDSHSIKDL